MWCKAVSAVLLALALASSPALAAKPCSAYLAPFSKDHPLRLEVERLEQGVVEDRAEVERVAGEAKELREGAQELRSRMGFREKYLFAWLAKLLGGDVEQMRAWKAQKKSIAEIDGKLGGAKAALSESDKQVVAAIEQWLAANDRLYSELAAAQASFYETVCVGQKCLQRIDRAISDVESAESDDLLAGMTDNKLLEYVAASDTQDANRSIGRAKAAVQEYRNHLETVRAAVNSGHAGLAADHIEGVDPTLQLVVDLVTGQSFMDIMNFFALSDSENQLRSLRDRVLSIHGRFEAANRELLDQMQGRVCQAREACQALLP